MAHTVWRALRDGGSTYLKQRLGFAPRLKSTETLWIHAASVGEIKTVMPLLQALATEYPQHTLLVTTNTPTGKTTLEKAVTNLTDNKIVHAFLPIDYRFAIKRFLARTGVSSAIIVETEIWPKLYRECARRDLPIVIVNGRISERTAKVTTSFLAETYATALQAVSIVFARSKQDAELFTALSQGNKASSNKPVKTCVLGNLKKISASLNNAEPSAPALVDRAYCVLASTHQAEEIELTREWLTRERSELLVVAPRHPDRAAKLIPELKALSPDIAVRSRAEPIEPQTKVYLADTLGELAGFFTHTNVVFIGGSIAKIGGHNVLEPARAACATIVGPEMFNFTEELEALKANNAIVQVDTVAEVIDAFCDLLDNPEKALALGERAKQTTLLSAGEDKPLLENYLAELAPWLVSIVDLNR